MTSTEQKFYALLLSIEDKLNQLIEKDKLKDNEEKNQW
jgi:hypothetical protein